MTTESPWQIDQFDLDGYLARLQLSGAADGPASRAALDALHEAHVRAFTFDNIDVLLDRHPGVDLAAVQAKFVGRGRGGYCFEHGTLFAAALERLGYQVERRLGRVGDPLLAARTHTVVVVTVDGERLLADPGFGFSLLRPIPLADGATDEHGGWAYRLRQVPVGDGRGWALHRGRDGGLGTDAHPRRAPGPSGGSPVRPPLHQHLPDEPLPTHVDPHPSSPGPARDRDARGGDRPPAGRADGAPTAARRRAAGTA